MSVSKELIKLDPEELLDFLKNISHIEHIWVQSVDTTEADNGIKESWNIPFNLQINNYTYKIWVDEDCRETIASYYFYDSAVKALKNVRHDIAKSLADWLDVYHDYIKNDTGHRISDQFFTELTDETERILNLFE